MATLVLVRHGQSVWNLENRFTGWVDVDLSEKGELEAQSAGEKLSKYTFDAAFSSVLKRANRTLDTILQMGGQANLEVTRDAALNERMYGDLPGMNKDEAREQFGAEQVHIWRRSYDVEPPGGESLKTTGDRTIPYFEKHIAPLLKAGKSVIIAAHGNSLRALVKHLENLSPEEILQVEIPTGTPMVYQLDSELKIQSKTILE